MNIKSFLPSPQQLSAETLAVIGATLIAAYFFSRFPAVQRFINANSVTVKPPEESKPAATVVGAPI